MSFSRRDTCSASHVVRRTHPPRTSGDLSSCPSRARCHGEPRTTTVRISLTGHDKTSLLTIGYEPDLCKAVLDLLREPAPNQEMPSPGRSLCQVGLRRRSRAALAGLRGRSLRWPATNNAAARPGLGRVWPLLDLPTGYHTASRGQSLMTHASVFLRAAPRMPCGRAGARSTRRHTAPAWRSSVIPPPLRSLEEKHLTQNQDVWQQADRRSDPASVPIYISWYINDYGRPWTPLDVNPRIRHVHGQIAGTGGVLLMTTEQKAFVTVPYPTQAVMPAELWAQSWAQCGDGPRHVQGRPAVGCGGAWLRGHEPGRWTGRWPTWWVRGSSRPE
jgi:hypothetical protein